jgi:hypothetical protein
MAEKKKDGPESIRLPGDPIVEPVELDLPLATAAPATKEPKAPEPPAREAAPVAAAPDKGAKPAETAVAPKEVKPAEPQGNGPHNNYGVEEPTSSSPDAWLKYDEDLLKAKDAYEKEHPATAAATVAEPVKPAEEKPVVAGEYQPPPPREAPATLSADDKFELEPGAEWTRGAIVNEILTLRKIRDDRDKAYGLFGQPDYAALEAGWKPFLDTARANPGLVPFLSKMQDDFFRREEYPDYAAFMDENAEKYAEWRKNNPGTTTTRKPAAGPAAEEVDSPALQRVAALEKQLQDRDAATANRVALERVAEQVKTERLGLWKTYPVLEQEPALWSAIKNHAIMTATAQRNANGGRPATYTLTDAVRDQWPLVLKFLENRKTPPAATDATPVPVRGGGQEGANVRTSEADQNRERVYASTADAAKAWMLENPDGFKG